MPRFRRFCAIFKYNEENTIEKIKQNLKIETKFIGIYKLNVFDEMNSHIRDEMYIYVQFDKCDLEKKRVEKKLEPLGEILELSSFGSIRDDLEYISSEGELKDSRTKKNPKKIEINAVGDEDYTGIYTSGLGESMERIIQNKINEFKRLIEECPCREYKCMQHGISRCNMCSIYDAPTYKTTWYFETNHRPQCGKIYETLSFFQMNLDVYLSDLSIRYFTCHIHELYKEVEKFLLQNKKNRNVFVDKKGGKYSYFDGSQIKNERMDTYFNNIIYPRCERMYKKCRRHSTHNYLGYIINGLERVQDFDINQSYMEIPKDKYLHDFPSDKKRIIDLNRASKENVCKNQMEYNI